MRISIPLPSHAQLHGGGFEAGFFHPVLGFDHLLAMIAVGIIATQLGGRATYLLPLNFMIVMLIGALFGFNHISFMNDELAIQLSVLTLGIIIAIDKKIFFPLSIIFISFFAFFHGHAHGEEIPKMSSAWKYAGGFILATGLLHLCGVSISYSLNKIPHGRAVVRHLGSAIMGIGFYMLFRDFLQI